MSVTVFTDSTCDLPVGMAAERGIRVVPLYVLFGGETFQDGVTLSTRQFFEKLVASSAHPSTSQPTPEDFLNAWQQVEGPILSVHISSSLSGTYNSALQAAKLMDVPSRVRVVDSDSVTCGLGLMALVAADAAAAGADLDGVEAAVRQARTSTKVWFTVETLEYLAKGGRIGRAQALLGGLLKIKPVLAYNDRAVSAHSKAFGFDQALAKIAGLVADDHARQPIRRIFVANGNSPANGAKLRKLVAEKLGGAVDIVEAEIGAVVGTHVGPGAVGVMYHS